MGVSGAQQRKTARKHHCKGQKNLASSLKESVNLEKNQNTMKGIHHGVKEGDLLSGRIVITKKRNPEGVGLEP